MSSQNRLVERHDATFGMYWKSYDFKGDDGPAVFWHASSAGRLTCFRRIGIPYFDQAFAHDGGEMIWALPNGLHAFMLTDGKGKRIDFGPTEVVRDDRETAGHGPAIFNGLSCMACHKHGTIELPKDDIRGVLQGKVRDKVRRLYPEKKIVDRLLEEDERDYLAAVDRVIAPYIYGASVRTRRKTSSYFRKSSPPWPARISRGASIWTRRRWNWAWTPPD